MKRRIMLCLLLLLGLFAQVSIARAISKTYIWHIGGYASKYEIYFVAQDHWKTGITEDVVVRLTLTDKHWSLDHAKTNWIQVVIKSSKFVLDSGRQEEVVTLTGEGDYWQKTIPMEIPSAELEQGENVTMSIEFRISIDEMDTSTHQWWNHVYSNSDDPIHADVTRPFPMFWETTFGILAIGLAVIVFGGIIGFIFYRTFYTRRTTSVKTPSSTTQ